MVFYAGVYILKDDSLRHGSQPTSSVSQDGIHVK